MPVPAAVSSRATICVAAALIAAVGCGRVPTSNQQAEQPTAAATDKLPVAARAEAGVPAPVRAKAPETESQAAAAPAAALAPPGAETARRCGWLHNPTPGNWWLFDGHGEWILASQGGEQALGMDDMPDLSAGEWAETNGHYGYACACMKVTAIPGQLQVFSIASVAQKPLDQCRGDKALPRP